ncbi:Uridylate kinase [Candidatus Norongarragalina meridionalis]|nr:Uridylate kinase [Candidatus Norongarragalina meridionalis]
MLVVSLGGSLLYEGEKINCAYVAAIAPLLKGKAVVVGGGILARKYADKARKETKNEFFADRAAIRATRINAAIVAAELNERVCTTFDDAALVASRGGTPVMGGMMEGLTTDSVSVLLAERLGAKSVLNLSKVAGIYDRDPSKKGARLLKKLTYPQLIALATKFDERKARTNFPFDLVACKLAARSKIRVDFADGRDLKGVRAALAGKTAGTAAK